MFIQLFFIFSSFDSLESAGCFNNGQSWTKDFLQDINLHVKTPQACLDICTKTSDCQAYTWMSGSYADQYLAESCLTFYGIGTTVSCQECTSGLIADCQVCSQTVECQIEHYIAIVPTSTEVGCKNICAYTTDCGYYIWFDSTTALKNFCFLLTSCGDSVECEGCSSGPPQCPTDYCTDIEYNLLDDPTRNEKHGKLFHAN